MKQAMIILLLVLGGGYTQLTGSNADYFLMDSVGYDSLSSADQILLDSILPLYHQAGDNADKLGYLEVLVNELYDEKLWPKYNEILLSLAKNFLEKEPDNKAYKNYLASAMINLGLIYKNHGNIEKALETYHISLKMKEEMGDSNGIASNLNNIAVIYKFQKEPGKALQYYRKANLYFEAIQNKRGAAYTANNIGMIYSELGYPDSTLKYYTKSLSQKKEINDQFGIAMSLNNLGEYYKKQGNAEQALAYYTESHDAFEKVQAKPNMATCLINIGRIHLENNDLAKALKNAKRSLALAREVRYPVKIYNAALLLYTIYKRQQKFAESLKMYELYIHMKDSVINVQNQKAAIKQQMTYEFEKKEALLQAEQEKQQLAHREKVKRQQLIIWAVGAGLLLVIVFSVFLYQRFKVTQAQKLVIEDQKKIVDEKNKHITDSINYAKKIQEAILPSEKERIQAFQNGKTGDNHFVLYLPKDIVSGDFYWVYPTPDNQVIWATADCTGHGVPGAFMSMIGTSLLNEIVIEKNIREPGPILNELRLGIKQALGYSAKNPIRHTDPSELSEKEAAQSQTTEMASLSETTEKMALSTYTEVSADKPSETTVKDGMDIALCSWDKNTNRLLFAGAYNPLYIYRNKNTREKKQDSSTETSIKANPNNDHMLPEKKADSPTETSIKRYQDNGYELMEVKANRQPIGIYIRETPFVQHELQLQPGDTLYTFSDGFTDQFGGAGKQHTGKKFTAKRLRELLFTMQDKPIDDQKKILAQTFESWKKDHEQLDDVCIIGVKI